jgi:hypothetical protein
MVFFNKDAKIELKQNEAGMGDAREVFPKFRNKSTVFSCGWEKRAEIERWRGVCSLLSSSCICRGASVYLRVAEQLQVAEQLDCPMYTASKLAATPVEATVEGRSDLLVALPEHAVG